MIAMKKIIQIALFSVLILASCDDYLDQYPINGLVQEEYWNNKEELHKVMIGAYAALADMDVQLFLFGELRADMLEMGNDIANFTDSENYTTSDITKVMEADILPSNTFAYWGGFYEVINYCNYVIKYAPIIKEKDDTFTDYYMQVYISEATALRSLMYFYLVRTFKDVPYITWPTESDMVELYPAKTDGEDILDAIIEEMVTLGAVEKMADYYGDTESTIGRINRYSAYAMIADIALWRFDYDLALTYIDKIESSGKYFLVSNDDWFTQFSDGNLYESLFEIQYDEAAGCSNRLYNMTIGVSSRYFMCSTYAQSLFIGEAYGDASTEKTRTEGTLLEDGTYGYKIYKYIGESPNSSAKDAYYRTNNFNDANLILYRYADIMLMKAEALSQKEGPDFEATLDIINTIRYRANVPLLTNVEMGQSAQEIEETILKERASELAYEGKRWYDLLRFARRNNYAQKDKFISLILENISPSQRLIMASKLENSNSWFLPIYQDEIDNNINLVQNPYYEEPEF